MVGSGDSDELELVRKAILLSDCRGYCDWNEKASRRVREELPEFTPEGVQTLLREFVVAKTGDVVQVVEQRGYPYRYYYMAIIPVPVFKNGLFVELRLVDNDPDNPQAEIVNAHEQK